MGDTQRKLASGISALQSGDAVTARALLAQIDDDVQALYPLAYACRTLGDDAAARPLLDALLAQQPGHIGALLMAGDLVAGADQRAASAYYQAALANASRVAPQSIPAAMNADLRRAQEFLTSAAGSYEAHLIDRLEAGGISPTSSIPRVRHAIDLLTGKREIFLQRPSSFYFPGLPQIEFFEREQFAWLPEIEAATATMQAELNGVMTADGDFAPYVETRPGRPPPPNHLRDDPSWGASYLWKGGQLMHANADRCPATMAALAAAPLPVIEERSPMALYSLLKPGTHIKPHHGLLNTRLIVHIPLIDPPECALRVGSETRNWRAGEALIFDDSIEHEAWNRGSSTRVVLLFEIWRPELTADERAALTILFTAVGEFTDQG
jgi:hypothetical protein